MSKRAVLVGINYVGKPNELKGCANDALAMRDLLIKRYGFRAADIRMLVDDVAAIAAAGITANAANVLLPPTRANIMSALEWLVSTARAGDQLVFTYSGHGVQSGRDASGDESDGRDECLLFSDGVLTDDDFSRQVLMRAPAGARMTVITDCCHSGTMCDMRFCYSPSIQGIQGIQRVNDSRGIQPAADIIGLSAALDVQTATDGAFEGKWVVLPNGRRQFQWGDCHGAFTWALLKVLEAAQYQPIPVDELLARVHTYISVTLKKEQVPYLSVAREALAKTSAF